jgi:hypothetical protein
MQRVLTGLQDNRATASSVNFHIKNTFFTLYIIFTYGKQLFNNPLLMYIRIYMLKHGKESGYLSQSGDELEIWKAVCRNLNVPNTPAKIHYK